MGVDKFQLYYGDNLDVLDVLRKYIDPLHKSQKIVDPLVTNHIFRLHIRES